MSAVGGDTYTCVPGCARSEDVRCELFTVSASLLQPVGKHRPFLQEVSALVF